MPDDVKFIAVRQARTKVVGSRVMTEQEAKREVAAWREHIGPAKYVQATPDMRSMTLKNDSEALSEILYAPEAGSRGVKRHAIYPQ